VLERQQPSPVVALNRAAAVAMVDGPAPALELVDGLAAGGELDRYHLLHAARAELLRRLGDRAEAAKSHTRALPLVSNATQRRSRCLIARGRAGSSPARRAGAAWTCATATRP